MSAIFISYRREDSEGHAGRLFEVLVERFGKASVFMDVAGIEPGVDFRKAIDANVAECGALLAVISKNWVTAKDDQGQRRIDDPHDFVRLETISALQRNIPVIPVLVHGAAMPRADQLPAEMAELAFRNGVELTHTRWDSDVQLLTKALERHVVKAPTVPVETNAPARSSSVKYIGIAIAAAVVAGGGAMVYQRHLDESPNDAKIQVTSKEAQPAMQPAAPVADAAKLAAVQEEAALKAKAEQEAAARATELRVQEEKIKQRTDALDAARVSAEKKIAEAERLGKIEHDKKTVETKPADPPAQNPLNPAATHPSGLRSIAGTPATSILFVNDGSRAVAVNWINFKGKEVGYLTLPPGKSFTQQTGVSHSWIVRDAETQRQVATAVGAAEATTVRIGEPRVAQGAGTDARKVTQVEFKDGTGRTAGYYKVAAPGTWVETDRSGTTVMFRFQETGRDEGSVYLLDKSRNVTIQLDLQRRRVMYQDSSAAERRPIYEIAGAN